MFTKKEEQEENILEDSSLVRTKEQDLALLHLLSVVLHEITYTKEDLSGNNLPDYSIGIDENVIKTTEEIYKYMIHPKVKRAIPKKRNIKRRIRRIINNSIDNR